MDSNDLTWRTDNIGRVLFSASYVFVRDELRIMNGNASVAVTQAQMALFQNLDAETNGLTQIAARAKMTKQAMLELVDKAERLGLVRRRIDPADRRAKHVELTAAGGDLVDRLGEAEAAAERRLASIVGGDFLGAMRTRLSRYIDANDAPQSVADASPGRRPGKSHLGRLLHEATGVYVSDAMRRLEHAGVHEVRDVHLALYRNLDLKGSRLTVVARRAQMTKPAMRELVDQAEALGFVERLPDPADGRAKIIRFTPAGLIMLGHVRDGILGAEATLAKITGNTFVREAKYRLGLYMDATDLTRLTAVDGT